MAKKYVALQDFGAFRTGDGVSVDEAGTDTDRLLSEGYIKEAASTAPVTPAAPVSPVEPVAPKTPPAADVEAAQQTLAAQADAQQQAALSGAGVAPIPSNVAGLASAFDVPVEGSPSAIGVGLMQASDRASQQEFARRMEKIRPDRVVGATLGPAEEVSGVVKPDKDGVVSCPNCNRRYADAARYVGSTLPCVCGFQIEVGA
jgi:hypothetical protein